MQRKKTMTFNLKSLGLLAVALLALSGLMAEAASAHTPARLTSAQNETTIIGVPEEGNTVLSATGQTVSCEIEEYHFTAVGTSFEDVSAKPEYTQCNAFGLVNAKITGFGHYPEAEGEGPYCTYSLNADGTVDLVCPVGREVIVECGTCVMRVPAQNNLGTISYSTATWEGKHALTLTINVSEITASYTDGFLCPLTSSGESATASLSGKARVWGEDPSSHESVALTWDATVA